MVFISLSHTYRPLGDRVVLPFMSLRRSARTKAANSPALVETATTPRTIVTGKQEPKKRAKQTAGKTNGLKKVKLNAEAEESKQSLGKDYKTPPLPTTPLRRKKATKVQPPITPTPSLVKIIAPYSSGDIDDQSPPPLDRPVEPHRTNATLVTPGGTQRTAYPVSLNDASPSKTGLPRPTATTGNLLERALEHLRSADARMIPLIENHHCHIFSPEGLAEEIDPFRSLASGIMAQQVSGAAAKSIKNKFIGLFHEGQPEDQSVMFPTPAQVAATDITRLRLAGLSQRKAEYIQGLAQKFVSGELSTEMLLKATDEEVMEKLIAVRGLGRWSVEMFACFGLKRTDVFSTGDLGVQRGMAAFMGRDIKKMKAKGGGKWKYMTEKEMESIAEAFRPYRTLFMYYMWRVEDTDVQALEGN